MPYLIRVSANSVIRDLSLSNKYKEENSKTLGVALPPIAISGVVGIPKWRLFPTNKKTPTGRRGGKLRELQ
jgi:hypothetical protein